MSLVALTAAQDGSGDEDLGIGARAFSAGNRNRGSAAADTAAADGERMGFNFGGNDFGGFDYGNYANYDLSGYDYGFDHDDYIIATAMSKCLFNLLKLQILFVKSIEAHRKSA